MLALGCHCSQYPSARILLKSLVDSVRPWAGLSPCAGGPLETSRQSLLLGSLNPCIRLQRSLACPLSACSGPSPSRNQEIHWSGFPSKRPVCPECGKQLAVLSFTAQFTMITYFCLVWTCCVYVTTSLILTFRFFFTFHQYIALLQRMSRNICLSL